MLNQVCAQKEETLLRLTTVKVMKTALLDISAPKIFVYLKEILVRLAPLYTIALTILRVAIMFAFNMVN